MKRLPHVTPRHLPPASPPREVPAWSEVVGIGAVVLVLVLIFVVGPVMAS
jgi:hypothetical protein